MIFTTKNNELNIFGKTLDDVRNKIVNFNNVYEQYGFWGKNGALASLFSGKKLNNILSPETLKQFDEFKEKFNSSSLSAEALAEQMENVDQKIIDYAKTCKNGEMTTEGFKKSVEGMTLSAKAGQIALEGLRIAGSMIAMWAISKGIELAVKGTDELAHSAEHCKERVDELMSNYQSALDKANSNAKTIEDLTGRYEELSKGVNNLGENVSLTADEYSEYNDIVNQIADMFPTLIQGYTNEGNAILSLKGNVEQLRDAYKEAQQEAYNMLIISGKDSDGNDIIKNWENLHGTDFFSKLFDLGADDVGGNISTQEAIKQLEALSNMSAEAYRNIEKITRSGTREEIASLTDIEKEIGYGSFLYKVLGIDGNVTDEAFAEARKQAQALIQTYQAEIDLGLNNIQTLANAYLMTNEDYDKLDEQSKTAASLLVNSIDEEIANGFSSKSDVGTYVVSIVNSIKDNQEVQDALINLLSLDTSKMSIEEAQNEINKYIAIIANYLDENPVDLKLRLGVDIQQDKKELRDRLSNGGQDLVVDDWIDSLTVDEAKLANSTTFDEALKRQTENLNGAALSAENYSAALDEVKASQDGIGDETGISPLSISQTIDQLNTQLKPAFDSLQSAYQDIFDDDGKFQLNSIDILSTCDSIKSKLDELNKIDGITVDYSAFEDFVKVLNNTESKEHDVKTAFDSLATSITQAALSGAEDFETMKAALEDLGVVNSEMVAFDALISNTEALKEAGLDLSEATYEEIEAFAKGIVSAENYNQAVNLLKIQKILCAENPLDTSGDIMNLYLLANAAGIATDAILQLMRLNAEYAKASAEGNTAAALVAKGQIEVVKQTVLNQFANLDSEVDFSGVTKAAKSGGKDAGDAYVEAFEDELKSLQDLRDRGVIDESEYLQRLRALYTRYFADRKEYLNEFKKYEREYLEGMKSLYDSALSGITKLMSHQIDGYNEAKDAAVSSLEAEKEARLEVIETQKEQLESEQDLIDKQIEAKQDIIDSIQKEIDAMKAAREERQRQLDLQKALYDLERAKNQHTMLQYSEKNGIRYVTDNSAIKDAEEKVDDAKFEIEVSKKEKEIKLIEEEIDLLEEKKDLIQDQIDALDKQTEEIEKYYSKLISEQEKYWDSMISNMEKQKSKWEELAEVEEIAKAYSAIEQVFGDMGYTVQDILNGNGQAFEDFKSRYIAIMSDMNQNTSFQEGLEYASGVAKENFESIISDAQGAAQELSQTFSDGTFSQAITQGVSDGIVSAKQELDKMDQLGKDAGDGLLNGWDEKSSLFVEVVKQTAQDAVEAFAEGQDSHSPSEKYKGLAGDAIDGLLLGVEENKQAFIDTIRSLAEDGLLAFEEGFQFDESSIKTSFDSLILLIQSVSEALGFGTEGSVNGLLGALSQLSTFSLGDENGSGILSQFESLKTAVDGVVSAISGGGASGGSASGSSDKGKGSGTGGGSGLVGAIEDFKSATDEALGSGGGENSEGEGSEGGGTGAIGQFEQLKTAVDDVTAAIGSGDSDGGQNSAGENEDNLVGSIDNLGDTSTETLGESGGDGVIGKFEEFKNVIEEAANQVASISDGLEHIDGQEVECTITVNVKMNGSFPQFADGTALGQMQIESATYNAQYGKAFASGTIGLPKAEKNALVSEYGQTEMTVLPNGKTIITDKPTMMDLPKDTVIYNEEQTKKIMDNKVDVSGNAHADGTDDSIWTTLADGTKVRPLQPGDKMYDMVQKFDTYFKRMDGNLEQLVPNSFYDHQKQMENMVKHITNISNISNSNKPSVNIGDIHVTCPGVTSQQVAEQLGGVLGKELDKQFSGFHNYVDQQSRIR